MRIRNHRMVAPKPVACEHAQCKHAQMRQRKYSAMSRRRRVAGSCVKTAQWIRSSPKRGHAP